MSENTSRFAFVQRDAYDKIIAHGFHEVFPTYIAMLMHVFGTGECFVSVTTIEEWTNTSRRTVFEHLRKLECAGIIEVIGTTRDDGGTGCNRYRLISWKLYSAPDCTGASAVDCTGASAVDCTSNIKGLKNTKNNNNGDTRSESTRTSRFTKPELSQIQTYMRDDQKFLDNEVQGEKFFDFYESNGWKVGKNPMKDWKSAVRNWKRRMIERDEFEEFKMKAPWPEEGKDYRAVDGPGGLVQMHMDGVTPFHKGEWRRQWLRDNGYGDQNG